ncbi:phage resistance protein [Kitasatospora purpeofusca]|uniref:BREX-2 system ATPase PglY n=1 Tax=Kitasatospora purpeofusca TaxID=67352 RepID=UPI0032538C78
MATNRQSSSGTPLQPPLLREVIDIKPRISTSDFVLKLAEAVTEEGAAAALRDYVITDRLVENFDEATGLIRAALDGQTSKAAYLHGSFGSGKSHFMAVLHALLRGDQAARAREEFTDLLARNADWLGGGTAQHARKRFLLVPYHMLGAKSLEQRVLGGYVAHIKALHPEAPTPQVYRTDSLMENIQATRRNVGDDLFISKLAESGDDAVVDDEWGDAFAWTTEKLDAAIHAEQIVRDDDDADQAAPINIVTPTTPAELRAKLVHDALISWFPGFFSNAAEDEYGFISLDRGLGIIAEHAKALGYDGVILFLDELILWLANSIHDSKFVAREAGKITNFIEGGDARRAIPVISFIARQRDLRELVGEEVSGSAEAAIQDTLNLASGRFDLITLEDRNLPVIANKRLLQPIDAAAEARIDAAFAKAKRVSPQVWDILLGSEEGTTGADEASFRLTYPFSPAFMDTLVHISGALQRSRTGLKLMGQLLADHRNDARLEQLIPIGDLYQVIAAGGDEPFVAKLKAEFKAADKLYKNKLRPYLLETYSLTEDDVVAADADPAAITDPQLRQRLNAFRGDNRLICTLLLSALAPSVPALRDLTLRRLTALNHGSITSPIPGGEIGMAKSKVAEWATRFAEIKPTGTDSTPGVRLELVGVDVDSVIANANVNNRPGTRRALMRKLLWEELGVSSEGRLTGDELPFTWRGSARSVEVAFGNIADRNDLEDHEFRPSTDSVWKLVFDMPYDEGAYGPAEDANRVREFRTQNDRPNTVCWIPSHFSAGRYGDFQRLVTIDSALDDPKRFDTQYAAHLNPDNRQRAKGLLEGQRETLIQTVKKALRQAYGLNAKSETDVQPGYDEHLMPIPDITLTTSIGQSLHDAARHVARQLLNVQYPAHPDFDPDGNHLPVRASDMKTVFGYVRQAVDSGDDRVEVVAKDRDLMRRIAGPLKLGVQHEAYFQLGRHWVEHFNRTAASTGVTGDLSVVRLTDWIDEPDSFGLDPFVANLVIAAFAEQADRVWTRQGGPVDPPPADPSAIRSDYSLREQAKPEQEDWDEARARFMDIVGEKAPTLRRGRIVSHFAKQITDFARQQQAAADNLVAQLLKHARTLGLDEDDSSGRLYLARRSAELLDALIVAGSGTNSAKQVVTTLASFNLGGVPARRYGTSVKSAHRITAALAQTGWEMLELGASNGPEGQAVLESLRGAARADELTAPLAAALDRAQKEIVNVMRRAQAAARAAAPAPTPTLPPEPVEPPVSAASVDLGTTTSHPPLPTEAPALPTPSNSAQRAPRRSGGGRTTAARMLAELRAELDELAAREPDAVIEISWRVVE